MTLSEEAIERYSRQLILKEVGGAGQEKLAKARVLIIGAGGLGSPAALYLATAGIGHLGILDSDPVELSNLQRQILYTTQEIGREKVAAAKERLTSLNPLIEVVPYAARLTAENAAALISEYDFIVEGSDNFETKFLVNDTCISLKKPFTIAGVLQYQGQLTTLLPGVAPCYRCIFPEPPDPNCTQTCQEAGVLGSIAGVIGSLQATEVLKYFLGLGKLLHGTLLTYDATLTRFKAIPIEKSQTCHVCSEKEVFHRG